MNDRPHRANRGKPSSARLPGVRALRTPRTWKWSDRLSDWQTPEEQAAYAAYQEARREERGVRRHYIQTWHGGQPCHCLDYPGQRPPHRGCAACQRGIDAASGSPIA